METKLNIPFFLYHCEKPTQHCKVRQSQEKPRLRSHACLLQDLTAVPSPQAPASPLKQPSRTSSPSKQASSTSKTTALYSVTENERVVHELLLYGDNLCSRYFLLLKGHLDLRHCASYF